MKSTEVSLAEESGLRWIFKNVTPSRSCIGNLAERETMHKLPDSNSLKLSNGAEGLAWVLQFEYQLRQRSLVLTPHKRKCSLKQMEASVVIHKREQLWRTTSNKEIYNTT